MTVPTAKQEFGGVDILRFCAAIAVVLYHYYFWIWAFPRGLAARTAGIPPQPELGYLFSWGWIGVEVFFVISGFVIAFSAENSSPWRFAKARFRRLVPAVLICAPITAGTLFLINVFDAGTALRLTAKSLIFHPFSPWVDSVYWTLGIEIFFYFVIWTLLLIGRTPRIEAAGIVIGLISTAFWVIYFPMQLTRYVEARPLELLLVQHGCFFAIGVLLWAMRTRGVSGLRVVLAVLFTLIGVLQILSECSVISAKVDGLIPMAPPVLGFLLALALIVASLWMKLAWSGWRQIGLATYPLYLIHNAVGAALIGQFTNAGLPYIPAALVTLMLVVAFSCLVAWKLEPAVRNWLSFRRTQQA